MLRQVLAAATALAGPAVMDICIAALPQVALRLSNMYNGAEHRPPTRTRQMLEYPGVPPPKPQRFIDRELTVYYLFRC